MSYFVILFMKLTLLEKFMPEPLLTTLTLIALRPAFTEIAKNINSFLRDEFLKHYQLRKFSINNRPLS